MQIDKDHMFKIMIMMQMINQMDSRSLDKFRVKIGIDGYFQSLWAQLSLLNLCVICHFVRPLQSVATKLLREDSVWDLLLQCIRPVLMLLHVIITIDPIHWMQWPKLCSRFSHSHKSIISHIFLYIIFYELKCEHF